MPNPCPPSCPQLYLGAVRSKTAERAMKADEDAKRSRASAAAGTSASAGPLVADEDDAQGGAVTVGALVEQCLLLEPQKQGALEAIRERFAQEASDSRLRYEHVFELRKAVGKRLVKEALASLGNALTLGGDEAG